MTRLTCWKCDKPLTKLKISRVAKYCGKACERASSTHTDRPYKEERVLQETIHDARGGDLDAQATVRRGYGVRGLLRGKGYLTVEEALENMVRF